MWFKIGDIKLEKGYFNLWYIFGLMNMLWWFIYDWSLLKLDVKIKRCIMWKWWEKIVNNRMVIN